MINDLDIILITKWIISKDYSDLLLKAYITNKAENRQQHCTSYEFYTDGSLLNGGSTEMVMENSWIQTQDP